MLHSLWLHHSQVEALLGRRTRSKELEYEVKFVGRPEKDNRYWTRAKLIAEGYEKLVKQTDERIASEEAGAVGGFINSCTAIRTVVKDWLLLLLSKDMIWQSLKCSLWEGRGCYGTYQQGTVKACG